MKVPINNRYDFCLLEKYFDPSGAMVLRFYSSNGLLVLSSLYVVQKFDIPTIRVILNNVKAIEKAANDCSKKSKDCNLAVQFDYQKV